MQFFLQKHLSDHEASDTRWDELLHDVVEVKELLGKVWARVWAPMSSHVLP